MKKLPKPSFLCFLIILTELKRKMSLEHKLKELMLQISQKKMIKRENRLSKWMNKNKNKRIRIKILVKAKWLTSLSKNQTNLNLMSLKV